MWFIIIQKVLCIIFYRLNNVIENVHKFLIILGTIKSYDVPRVPQRIKRHTLFGFAYPIINPPKIPNSGGFSLPWFPGKSTKFDDGKQNLVDNFEPVKN